MLEVIIPIIAVLVTLLIAVPVTSKEANLLLIQLNLDGAKQHDEHCSAETKCSVLKV